MRSHPDAALIAAEQEIATLRSRLHFFRAAGDLSDHDEINDRIFRLEDEISATEATTLAGALVKLRRLADPEIGIDAGTAAGDGASLRQALAVIEEAVK